jgi:hypothetical protein
MLGHRKIRDDRFVRDGGIIEGQRAGKESVSGDPMGVSRMSSTQDCEYH